MILWIWAPTAFAVGLAVGGWIIELKWRNKKAIKPEKKEEQYEKTNCKVH